MWLIGLGLNMAAGIVLAIPVVIITRGDRHPGRAARRVPATGRRSRRSWSSPCSCSWRSRSPTRRSGARSLGAVDGVLPPVHRHGSGAGRTQPAPRGTRSRAVAPGSLAPAPPPPRRRSRHRPQRCPPREWTPRRLRDADRQPRRRDAARARCAARRRHRSPPRTRASRASCSRATRSTTRLERCDEHTVERQTPALVERMLGGEVIALVSDAGTPGVSRSRARGSSTRASTPASPSRCCPGASAILAALVASGLPTHAFYFGGFLPRKAGERRRALERARRRSTRRSSSTSRRTARPPRSPRSPRCFPGATRRWRASSPSCTRRSCAAPIEELAEPRSPRARRSRARSCCSSDRRRARERARRGRRRTVRAARRRARSRGATSRSAAVKQVAKELGRAAERGLRRSPTGRP